MQSLRCYSHRTVQRPVSLMQQHQNFGTCSNRRICSLSVNTLSRAARAQLRRQRRTQNIKIRRVSCESAPEALVEHVAEQSGRIPENKQGHAVLHDFCMGIPYGIIVLAAGLVSLFFGSGQSGLILAVGGALVLQSAVFSLSRWRAERPSRLPTIISAGFTTGLAAWFWRLRQADIASVPNTAGFGLSIAMLAFLAYNILAGGNPPKKANLDDTKPASTPAAA